MKKMNKKGFTLIELLAVIVILAIIMVIAVPQILNVIDSSRASAWNSNVKLIDEAITLNSSLGKTEFADFDLEEKCKAENFTTEIEGIADISSTDTTVTCSKTITNCEAGTTYEITVSATADGQFDGQDPATLCY